MIEFKSEGIEALDEMIPHLKAHAAEVNWINQPVSPNRELYQRMLENGSYVLFTARLSGNLIGYAGFFVHCHPHYENFRQAVSDVIYIRPDQRRGFGGRLIDYAEKHLAVNAVIYFVTVKKDYSVTLIARGYKLIEHTYAKILT